MRERARAGDRAFSLIYVCRTIFLLFRPPRTCQIEELPPFKQAHEECKKTISSEKLFLYLQQQNEVKRRERVKKSRSRDYFRKEGTDFFPLLPFLLLERRERNCGRLFHFLSHTDLMTIKYGWNAAIFFHFTLPRSRYLSLS